jgi:hypothetical protein
MVQLVRHPQTKERDTDRLHLNHRATSRLYPRMKKPATRAVHRRTDHTINPSTTATSVVAISSVRRLNCQRSQGRDEIKPSTATGIITNQCAKKKSSPLNPNIGKRKLTVVPSSLNDFSTAASEVWSNRHRPEYRCGCVLSSTLTENLPEPEPITNVLVDEIDPITPSDHQ